MGMATWHIVFLTDLQNALDGLGHHGVFVLSGVAELLAQVPLTDQHYADASHLLQDLREMLDRTHLFTLDDRQDFPLGCEGPHVGPGIVLLLREAPVSRRSDRGIATDARWVVEGRFRQTGVAAGPHRIARLFDGAHMWEDDA